MGASSKGIHTSGSLRITTLMVDAKSSADELEEMSVPVSSPRLPISRGLATGSVTHVVTSSVIYVCQLEDDAAASSRRDLKDGPSKQQPSGSDHRKWTIGGPVRTTMKEPDPVQARRLWQDPLGWDGPSLELCPTGIQWRPAHGRSWKGPSS